MYVTICVHFSLNTILTSLKNVSRTLHDVIVRNIAENIASISSGFNNGPPSHWQLGVHQIDEKPTSSTPSTSSTDSSTSSHVPGASNISGSSSSVVFFTRIPLPQLPREDFPKVQYWYADAYTSRRKNGEGDNDDEGGKLKIKGDTSVLSSFMEDENGVPIPKGTRTAARGVARGFFQLLLNSGRAPSKWGSASIDITNELTYRLETQFPFLRLCDGHWKSRQIATNGYSQWLPTATKNRAATLAKQAAKKPADSQVIDVDADNTDCNEPQKRPRDEDNEARRPKRPRVEAAAAAQFL